MKRSLQPIAKRLVATQARRKPSAVILTAKAIPQLMLPKRDSNDSITKSSLRTDRSLESQTFFKLKSQEQNYYPSHKKDAAAIAVDSSNQTNTEYYSTSSFETALDQVLRLERESASTNANNYHSSMEACVRDLFRV
eukprot:CAMPEP_0197194232 /NCGR_PEP_ID=MMETSP1423-20130617/28880_1 /TAXON_ID=476441 /ORGANISM="Pseudo-nitzschia heimii, Strain UNC1101" /LENGTH=136 /DNA_ID=CAMNT_0042647625 /DNA_START=51 /DNA_END=461 /DNA_ORIENTATION=+